jgi:hypothetical protein
MMVLVQGDDEVMKACVGQFEGVLPITINICNNAFSADSLLHY